MLLSLLALGVLIGQLPTSASPSQLTTDQSGSITVIAQEDGSGVPIEGIAITFASPDSQKVASKATTFANGTVEFTGLPPGRYFVMASSSELLGATSPGIGNPQRSVNLKPGAHEVIAFTFRRPAVIRGQVLGKPADNADAERMLRLLSGGTHDVLTGICVHVWQRRLVHVEPTRVRIAPLSDAEIAWYVGTGEPMDKAGGYAVQGRAARFIEGIEGSYSNVVGLPIAHVYNLLKVLGCDILTV